MAVGGGSFGVLSLFGLLLLGLVRYRVKGRAPSVLLTLFALLGISGVQAEEAQELPEVTVSAGTETVKGDSQVQEQKVILEKVPGATNLINLENHEGSQASLARILSSQPGIIVQEFFGGNDQPRVNIRGSGIQDNPVSRGIQLLYDGLPINQADGSFIIGLTDPEQARYISVYRGANAMRYGATTLGGAIDFGQRTARNNPAFSVRLEGGSWGQQKIGANLQYAGEKGDVYLQATHSESEGWRDWSQAERSNLTMNVGFAFAGG